MNIVDKIEFRVLILRELKLSPKVLLLGSLAYRNLLRYYKRNYPISENYIKTYMGMDVMTDLGPDAYSVRVVY